MGVTERAARACSRRPWLTIGAWIAALVVAVSVVALLGLNLTTEGGAAGNTEHRLAEHAIERAFPPNPKQEFSDFVIVRSDRYAVSSPKFAAFVHRTAADAKSTGVVQNEYTYYSTHDPRAVSTDRHATLIPIELNDDSDAKKVLPVVERADRDPSFTVTITGDRSINNDFATLSQDDLKSGELEFGAPAALIILLLVFGAVVAGVVPLLMAIASIVLGVGLIALLSHVWELSIFAVNMLTGMGLALGIDYSLFVISRYREERHGGRDEAGAISMAGATASRAVLFSGTAFVVAMFGMLIVPNTIMRSLAAAAILVGAVSVLAALTLLPAIIGVLGDRVNALRIPLIGSPSIENTDPEGRFWRAVITRVLRVPALSLVLSVAILVALALPVFGMHIGTSGVTTLPDRFVSKRGFVELQRDFPQTRIYPARVVVRHATDPGVAQAIRELEAKLRADRRFTYVSITRSTDRTTALLNAALRADPASPEAVHAVRHVRDHLVPRLFGKTDAVVRVGGNTSEQIDYLDSVTNPAPWVFLFVLGLTFILLTIVFRSLVISAKAIVLNLLSVGAAYGLLVLVFQDGHGAGLLGFQTLPTIEAWVPLFLFSVLFALSMDYHVFLLSRIRERYDATGDTTAAVSWGVASTARIITGAALIIVAVFTGFAMGDLIMFQQMGFGVAISLLLDATLIRSVLLPSAMKLFGRWNWWLPRWLEWLPNLQVERGTARPGLQA